MASATVAVCDEGVAAMSQPEAPRWHQPVMVREVVSLLAPADGDLMLDVTTGTGGHSVAVLPYLGAEGRLIAMDRDAQTLELARKRLAEFRPQVEFVHESFAHVARCCQAMGVTGVDGLVADLGLCGLHVEEAQRGFSMIREGPLDMRMDRRQELTAAHLIERYSRDELTTLLRTYGEERWASRIAGRIVETRRRTPILTTTHLARVVAEAVPRGRGSTRLHPATRTFQALRIAVNDELGCLQALLKALPELLKPGGRAVVIAYHSLEDRMVKQMFREGAQSGVVTPLTRKPIRPSASEIRENPRSRSAKLRAIERCPTPPGPCGSCSA